jgi:hypothetical protein
MAALFGFVFWRTLLLDLEHSSRLGQGLKDHLLYTLRLKDDMASIDWGKSLEAAPGVKVFSVTKDYTEILSGGNRQRVPGAGPEGVRFQFPDSIVYETSLATDGGSKVRFVFLSEPLLDPWKAAGLSALGVLLLGFFFRLGFPMPQAPVHENSSAKMKASKTTKPQEPSPAPPPTEGLPPGGLSIDPHFRILQWGPGVPELFGLPWQHLMNGHLLDLSPDPSLLQAIEKREKQKVIEAFLKNPGVSATVEPTPEGFLLVLKRTGGSQNPKKP